ncbi:hypothetical protein ATJ88_1277 [Isoptericola jiangsuensis]|uniref:IPT/TIG domain-containing protein n=1 Tax=Isoptericola jiangsuensis TaxID=548579 RepID=A0A2A9EUA9_9MICO|nr:hypothetical protein [Isoptericola jiangsuensis]PFG42614.1 hypothetical protein ATJ88_1277 [Isoptericola jiangsuensis]
MPEHRPALAVTTGAPTGARVLAAVLAGLVVAGTSGCATASGTPGENACAAPAVEADPATVAPGDTMEITGVGFAHGCEDHPAAEESTSMTDVPVRWLQGGVTVDLGVVDADEHGGWALRATVPADAVPGQARIDASPSTGVEITVGS